MKKNVYQKKARKEENKISMITIKTERETISKAKILRNF